jgi:glycosyltransferase involved in cell wall biosynthesis
MVSFVVRSRDEQQHIGFAIQSIMDHFGAKTHIVVVDNESNDETLRNVSVFPPRFYNIEIITIARNEYSPGRALNMGIARTKTPIVGILSAHCQITKIDVTKLKTYFTDPMCFGVIGKQIPVYKGKKITPRYIWQNFCHATPVQNVIEHTEEKRHFFHNAFSFVNRNIWEGQPFDEDLYGKEDRFWADKLITQGKHFYLDPNFMCHHFWTPNGATWINIG